MLDKIIDYMAAIVTAIFLAISIFTIPEIKNNKKIRKILAIGIIISVGIGFYQIHRSNVKEDNLNNIINTDTASIGKIGRDLKDLSKSYQNDTSRFNDFKNKLDRDFHIKDSAGIPVSPTIINNIDKVNYLKQF